MFTTDWNKRHYWILRTMNMFKPIVITIRAQIRHSWTSLFEKKKHLTRPTIPRECIKDLSLSNYNVTNLVFTRGDLLSINFFSKDITSFIILLTYHCYFITAANCKPGKTLDQNNHSICVDCPKGYYKEDKGPQNCTKCPENTTTKSTGATNKTQCVGEWWYE